MLAGCHTGYVKVSQLKVGKLRVMLPRHPGHPVGEQLRVQVSKVFVDGALGSLVVCGDGSGIVWLGRNLCLLRPRSLLLGKVSAGALRGAELLVSCHDAGRLCRLNTL